MSLLKREPRPWPLDTVWSQDLVDTAFRDMFRNFFGAEGLLDRVADAAGPVMRLEEFIDGETCVIRAEMPGIDPEKDVTLTMADGMLHLSAEREERSEEDRADGYRSEFRYGRLVRHVRLPKGTTEAEVSATYKDGILEVRVPAPKEAVPAAPTTIPVVRG